ncbi:carboxypeptidase-like regulatory domain-containing protein [Kordia zhangzhouensis]|uniref:carboxypeptidase-like regulatory domain-containing protein n=1 Tax=Kordia zhangzhouensis TaxID=1620405 RepID=UPI0009E1DDA8|nr:carboxypeptidase-like regulatory domain-containing protein [Kordia zhangzhouensis]
MKKSKLSIQIPEPCHEDWNQMLPTEKGKFCKVCTKEVVDFTSKSDEELIRYFSTKGNLCGRFDESQLNRELIADRKKRNHWLSYVASLLFPLSLFSQEKQSSVEKAEKTVQTDTLQYKKLDIGSLQRKAKATLQTKNDSITVKGIVTDDTGIPLPGATILVKGTIKGTTSDFDGEYTIKIIPGDALVVKYLGYETITRTIENTHTVQNFSMKIGEELETIVVVGYSVRTETSKLGAATIIDASDLDFEKLTRKERLEKRAQRKAKRAARKAEREAKRKAKKNS